MKTTLLFDFMIDKSTNMVFIYREFDAELTLVWNAFTKARILDQWWAPKPWTSKTKHMNFEVGGRRLYSMIGPDGQEHWSIQDFIAIAPLTNLKFISAVADKDENIHKEFSSSLWNLDFSESEFVTKVDITIKHKTLEQLEQHLAMGFEESFTMTLNELEQLVFNSNQ